MPCGVFRWTLVYFGVYTDPQLSMFLLEIVKSIYYRSHVSGGVLTFVAFKVL